MTDDTRPTTPLPDGEVSSEPRRRRRAWPWVVVGVVAVVVAALVVGEVVARQAVANVVRERAIEQLQLPADQPIDVEVSGSALLQLVTGTFGELRISSEDVAFGEITGNVVVDLKDVEVRGGGMGDGTATIALDQTQLRGLVGSIGGLPADAIGMSGGAITVSTTIELLGMQTEIGVGLTPGAADGELVLTPSSVTAAGTTMSADEVRDRFGSLVGGVLKDWPVCVARYLPAGLTLTDVRVVDGRLVAGFAVDGGIATDPALREKGTCS